MQVLGDTMRVSVFTARAGKAFCAPQPRPTGRSVHVSAEPRWVNECFGEQQFMPPRGVPVRTQAPGHPCKSKGGEVRKTARLAENEESAYCWKSDAGVQTEYPASIQPTCRGGRT